MADSKVTALTELTTPTFDDMVYIVDNPGGSPASYKASIKDIVSMIPLAEGQMINGRISVTVASNNLTVALKGADGNDPSATNPVFIRIGNTIRVVTAALSVTKNAGTNWCNSGASELATQEIDYFVYLGYNATDGVVIGFSRIPFAGNYSDFSTTTTNDQYCAISTTTNATSTDVYNVIGRFAATLSAGAGYTWTVPSFTNKNLIQRPIYETRWLAWIPTLTWAAGTAPTTETTGYRHSRYRISYNTVLYKIYRVYGSAGSTVTQLQVTPPIAMGSLGLTEQLTVGSLRTVPVVAGESYAGSAGNVIIGDFVSTSLTQIGMSGMYEI